MNDCKHRGTTGMVGTLRSMALLGLALTLAACGGGGADNAAGADKPADPLTSELSPSSSSITPTPTPPPDSDGDSVEDALDYYPKNGMAWERQAITVVCDVKGPQDAVFEIDRVRPDFKEAWRTPMPEEKGMFNGVSCESDASLGTALKPVSGIEQGIWDSEKRPDEYTIPIPYEQCVEHGTRWTSRDWPVGEGQIKEAQTALMLCPKHPDAAAIRSRIADLGALRAEQKQGRAFDDGNFRVGPRIQPGTYFTKNVSNCYWERLDAAGEIIDNNFVSDGLRVEVSIAPSDFSFHSEGCGTWRRSP